MELMPPRRLTQLCLALFPPRRAGATKVGGASAGSLLAACVQSGMAFDYVTEQCLRFMHELRIGGARGRMGVRGWLLLAAAAF